MADIYEEYAADQTTFILDFADALEKMLSNGYDSKDLVDAPDHYSGVLCHREKAPDWKNVYQFYNCYHTLEYHSNQGINKLDVDIINTY